MLLVSMTEWGPKRQRSCLFRPAAIRWPGNSVTGSFHLGRCRAETVRLAGCNFVRKMRAMVR